MEPTQPKLSKEEQQKLLDERLAKMRADKARQEKELEKQQEIADRDGWMAFAGGACDGNASIGHRLTKVLPEWEADDPDDELEQDFDPYELLTGGEQEPSSPPPSEEVTKP